MDVNNREEDEKQKKRVWLKLFVY